MRGTGAQSPPAHSRAISSCLLAHSVPLPGLAARPRGEGVRNAMLHVFAMLNVFVFR